jgi:hypothetical protein
MNELRPYQTETANKCLEVLKRLNFVYLQGAVRTGKTLIALKVAEMYGAKKVLFLTKKNAISSIESDYINFDFKYKLTIVNDESMRKLGNDYDLVLHDEHHRFGAFPKAGQQTKLFKQMFSHLPIIAVSGTPHPESYSQIFHQFWVSKFTPFKHSNFYKWAKEFVNVKQRHLGYGVINDYSDAKIELIKLIIEPYIVRLSQEQAGFKNKIKEHFIPVKMKAVTHQICSQLIKDKIFEGKTATIVADTGAKLQSKLHQVFSGTIKLDEGNSCIVDNSKAIAIKRMFEGKKIAIFYKFIAEKEMLIDAFGGLVTDNLEEFNTSDKSIIGQIQSIREGVNLSKAEAIVFLNIDFSALSYWQGRDRMTTIEREVSDIYWIFSEGGIESKIYKAVTAKKNYTTSVFLKDYGVKATNKANKQAKS